MGEPEPIESLVALFGALEDPRVDRTKGFSLEEILFLVLAAVVSGVNHLTRIEDFGNYKLDWLRTVLPYENGIPSHDTIGRVLGMLGECQDSCRMVLSPSHAAALLVAGCDLGGLRRTVGFGSQLRVRPVHRLGVRDFAFS